MARLSLRNPGAEVDLDLLLFGNGGVLLDLCFLLLPQPLLLRFLLFLLSVDFLRLEFLLFVVRESFGIGVEFKGLVIKVFGQGFVLVLGVLDVSEDLLLLLDELVHHLIFLGLDIPYLLFEVFDLSGQLGTILGRKSQGVDLLP